MHNIVQLYKTGINLFKYFIYVKVCYQFYPFTLNSLFFDSKLNRARIVLTSLHCANIKVGTNLHKHLLCDIHLSLP